VIALVAVGSDKVVTVSFIRVNIDGGDLQLGAPSTATIAAGIQRASSEARNAKTDATS